MEKSPFPLQSPVNWRLIDVFPVHHDRIADAIFTATTWWARDGRGHGPTEMAHRSQHVGTLGPGTLRVRTKYGHIYIYIIIWLYILIWKSKNHGRSDTYVIHTLVLKSFSECAIFIRKTPKALRPASCGF